MLEEDIRRYPEALTELLDRRGLKRRPLERELGWAKGTLTKLLQGKVELKVRTLLQILEAIGVAPLDFYAHIHRDEPLESRLLASFKPPQATLALPAGLTMQELEEKIEEAVRRALERQESPRA